MVLRKLSQTFKVTMALMLSVLSTGLLPVSSAYANSGRTTTNAGVTKVVDELGGSEVPNNEPILSDCDLGVEFYNFVNQTEETASVIFTPQAPTSDVTINVTGDQNPAVPGDGNDEGNGSNDPDGAHLYMLSFVGAPKTQGGITGYHVKVSTDVTNTNGGANHKVFWMPAVCQDVSNERPTLKPCVLWGSNISTDKDTKGWTLSSGAEYVDGGIKLSVDTPVDPSAWNEATITRALSGDLADLGTDITFTPDTQYLGLHVETSIGTLVYEKEPTYEGKWWSKTSFNVASGMGYATFDTLENIVAANPGVTLESLTVLYTSPIAASTTVTSVKIGCVEYTFDKAPRVPTECTAPTYEDSFIQPWTYDGQEYPYAGAWPESGDEAEYDFTEEGLYLSTPGSESYTYGMFDAGKTPLLDADYISYKTYRHDTSTGNSGTLTAYILLIDLDGDVSTEDDVKYLFYEPLYNGTVTTEKWQTWDAIDGGEAKWWMSVSGSQILQTWDYYLETYPDAIALSYGFNQGTSNAGTDVTIQDMVFDCATVNFESPGSGQGPVTPETPTDDGNVLGDNNGKVLATSTSTLPATLPATGDSFNPMMILITALAAYGAAYFAQGRRRVTDV